MINHRRVGDADGQRIHAVETGIDDSIGSSTQIRPHGARDWHGRRSPATAGDGGNRRHSIFHGVNNACFASAIRVCPRAR